MADPRNTVTLDGLGDLDNGTYLIDNVTITYDVTKQGGSASTGLACTLSASKTVALCADGDAVIGRLLKVESDNKAVVQTGDWVKFSGGTAAALTLGSGIVGALLVAAKGYVRAANSAVAAETVKSVGQIHDNTDTTAIIVRMN